LFGTEQTLTAGGPSVARWLCKPALPARDDNMTTDSAYSTDVFPERPASAVAALSRVADRSSLDRELTALMAGVGHDCRTSFRRLYRLTHSRLLGTVLRINPVRSEAEEVLQETYLRVWTERARFDASKGDVLSWMAAIARHRAIDSLRRRHARPALAPAHHEDEPAECYAAFAIPAPGPCEIAIQGQTAHAVQRLLGHAPEPQRQMLTLAFLEGLSHREIAQRLQRPLGTVKSTLRRALRSMRAQVAQHG
jgi:RNA polymerase sigma-70 factor (ECF subfamily)